MTRPIPHNLITRKEVNGWIAYYSMNSDLPLEQRIQKVAERFNRTPYIVALALSYNRPALAGELTQDFIEYCFSLIH